MHVSVYISSTFGRRAGDKQKAADKVLMVDVCSWGQVLQSKNSHKTGGFVLKDVMERDVMEFEII